MSLPSSSKNRPVVCVIESTFELRRDVRRTMGWRRASIKRQARRALPRRLDSQRPAVKGPGPSASIAAHPWTFSSSPTPSSIRWRSRSDRSPIRWYGLAYMAGILLGWLYGRYLVSQPDLWNGKPPMTVSQADDFLLWITLGIVVGGRLGFVLFYEPSYFWANPIEIPAVWNGGMSFHGGLLGVVIAVYLFSRSQGHQPAVARRHRLGGDAVRPVLRPHRQFHQCRGGGARERRALGHGVSRAPATPRAIRASSMRRRSKASCSSPSSPSPPIDIRR